VVLFVAQVPEEHQFLCPIQQGLDQGENICTAATSGSTFTVSGGCSYVHAVVCGFSCPNTRLFLVALLHW